MTNAAEARVWTALGEVHDPEIPTISLVDLGIVHHVEVTADRVMVELLPTFTGCPALDVMRNDVARKLADLAPAVDVRFTTAVPWTSDRITATGRDGLRRAGLAPPGDGSPTCPYCDSRETAVENLFGPTLCRSIWYCRACRQPFERFKSI
jgi:ring-1,2-phenylacetyl-CoA epoxidase subunit PaaD